MRKYGLRINLLVPVGLVFLFLLNGFWASAVMLLAAVLHELGHMLCARLVHAPIVRFDIELWGGKMYYGGMPCYRQELIIAVGGIAANVIFAPLGLIPFLGIYGKLFFYSCACYALVNIIPARSLDGGEILRCLLSMQKGNTDTESAERAVYLLSLLFIVSASFLLCILSGFNLSVILLCVFSLVVTVTDYIKKPA